MIDIFTRSQQNPILKPKAANTWESIKLYNPGAIFYNNQYHLFYRAMGSGQDWKSSIGYAVSSDGENFKRFKEPLLVGTEESEKRGLEDPRITKIEDTFFMAYAAYDGVTPRLSIATSNDLRTWKKHGPAFNNWKFTKAGGVYAGFDENGKIYSKPVEVERSKSGAIFSEKINNKYWMLFGEHKIWFATSNDGINWEGDQTPFLHERPGDYFDNIFVEMGPPPIKTKEGWLVLYHGVDKKHTYRIGFLILALNNPRKILYRSTEAIFGPKVEYELSGMVDVLPGGLKSLQAMSAEEQKKFLEKNIAKGTMPKVTFCCGATIVDDSLRIYYGASDSVICTASTSINAILKLAVN